MNRTIAPYLATFALVGLGAPARGAEPESTEFQAVTPARSAESSRARADASATAHSPEPAPPHSATKAAVSPAPIAVPGSSSAKAATPASKSSKAKAPWYANRICEPPDNNAEGDVLSTDCSGVFGPRLSITHLSGTPSNDAVGFVISAEAEQYVRRGLWTSRGMHRLMIGGGNAGFEGTLLGGWAGGVRLPVSPSGRHGPVLRIGGFGYIRGNDAFYGSLLELPQFQVGYQYQHGKTVIELGATTGAALVGRSRTGETERRVLGAGFEMGGYAALQTSWLRLGLSAMRLPPRDRFSTPVDVAEGTLCGRAIGLAICSDMRITRTDAIAQPGASPLEVRSLHAGLSLGFTGE